LNEEGEGRATKTPRRKGTQRKRSFGGEGIKLIVIERNKVIFRSHLMMLKKEIILHPGSPLHTNPRLGRPRV
jgi:hypothetical protein